MLYLLPSSRYCHFTSDSLKYLLAREVLLTPTDVLPLVIFSFPPGKPVSKEQHKFKLLKSTTPKHLLTHPDAYINQTFTSVMYVTFCLRPLSSYRCSNRSTFFKDIRGCNKMPHQRKKISPEWRSTASEIIQHHSFCIEERERERSSSSIRMSKASIAQTKNHSDTRSTCSKETKYSRKREIFSPLLSRPLYNFRFVSP